MCTQPCGREMTCGHGCSGRCGDACYCDVCKTRLIQEAGSLFDDEGLVEVEQQSLDDMLSESPRKRARRAPTMPPRSKSRSPTKNIGYPSSPSSGSSNDWRTWNAKQADAQLADKQRAAAQLQGTPQLVTIEETYRQTNYGNENTRLAPSTKRMITTSGNNAVAHNDKLYAGKSGNGAPRSELADTARFANTLSGGIRAVARASSSARSLNQSPVTQSGVIYGLTIPPAPITRTGKDPTPLSYAGSLAQPSSGSPRPFPRISRGLPNSEVAFKNFKPADLLQQSPGTQLTTSHIGSILPIPHRSPQTISTSSSLAELADLSFSDEVVVNQSIEPSGAFVEDLIEL